MSERYHERLVRRIAPTRDALVAHAVFSEVRDLRDLRVFMASHVFAVWDFMTLLKSLQARLTCLDTPWLPVLDVESARLVNEIVLAEETDEVAPGLYLSHFELYRLAMAEVGADREPVDALVDGLRAGWPLERALAACGAPADVADFVRTTMELVRSPVHVSAAAFVFGREEVIPDMFRRLLARPLFGDAPTGRLRAAWHVLQGREPFAGPVHLRRYLERHVHLDGEAHGPMSRALLVRLCGASRQRWEEAAEGAERALRARHALWRGVLARILAARRLDPHQIAERPRRQIG